MPIDTVSLNAGLESKDYRVITVKLEQIHRVQTISDLLTHSGFLVASSLSSSPVSLRPATCKFNPLFQGWDLHLVQLWTCLLFLCKKISLYPFFFIQKIYPISFCWLWWNFACRFSFVENPTIPCFLANHSLTCLSGQVHKPFHMLWMTWHLQKVLTKILTSQIFNCVIFEDRWLRIEMLDINKLLIWLSLKINLLWLHKSSDKVFSHFCLI